MIWIPAIFLPVLIALLLPLAGSPLRRVLPCVAALPALWLALFVPADGGTEVDSLLLGTRLGFGAAGQVFLLFSSVLWLVAAVYAQGYMEGGAREGMFHGSFLLTMAGNFGLILARDVPAFYTFFALMTFSAFGLVIHSGTAEARRAARVYLVAALAGEAMLLGAMFLAVGAAGSTQLADLAPAVADSGSRDLIILLAFFGFGVKAGALPVHFWLPLAHPVAPTPASAVLSGAMIKAGLLGWLYFMPLGEGGFPGWSLFCIVMGMAAAFGAVAAGCLQTEAKTMLAYSSISQMGVMTVILGIGLSGPEAGRAALPVLLLYALNHALAKGTLFLGTGIVSSGACKGRLRWLAISGLVLPALALAGAPWTGGSLVKQEMKALAGGMPEGMALWLDWLLPLSAAGTSLLLGKFLRVAAGAKRRTAVGGSTRMMWFSWLVLLAAVFVAVTFAARHYAFELSAAPGPGAVWKSAWPILLGVMLLLGADLLPRGWRARPAIPAGDLVVLLEQGARWLRARWAGVAVPDSPLLRMNLVEPLERLAAGERRSDFAKRMEERMRHRSVPGLLFILLALGLVALLMFGTPLR
jgi:formate hydrogenlyase subunit 3/multisubunit Na+/H+ antiporter MnhD subunit